jgi:hypothetical protein
VSASACPDRVRRHLISFASSSGAAFDAPLGVSFARRRGVDGMHRPAMVAISLPSKSHNTGPSTPVKRRQRLRSERSPTRETCPRRGFDHVLIRSRFCIAFVRRLRENGRRCGAEQSARRRSHSNARIQISSPGSGVVLARLMFQIGARQPRRESRHADPELLNRRERTIRDKGKRQIQ